MKYEEGRIDQFEDYRKTITLEERNELFREYDQRSVEMLKGAWNQIKSKITHSDDEDRYDSGASNGMPFKTANDRTNTVDVNDRKKPTWTPLIVFGILILAVIIAPIFLNPAYVFLIFFAGFSFFGFYAAYKNNGRASNFYEGTTSDGARKTGIMLGVFGLLGCIPLLLAGKLGVSNAFILMMLVMFSAVGIWLFVAFIRSLSLKPRKYKEEVSARCISYVRTIGSESDSLESGTSRLLMSTSPLFEYYYNGQTYRATYDLPIAGRNADIDMGPATIYIDPDHPEDIYRKAVGVGIKGLFSSILCLAVAVFIGCFFIHNMKAEQEKDVSDLNVTPENFISVFFGSDDERREAMEDMYRPEYEFPEEITDEIVMQRYDGEDWYYELVPVEQVFSYDDGQSSIELEGDNFPQLSNDHEASYWHDELIVFYTIGSVEYDGESHLLKEVFLYLNADEHTYTGSHGAYQE